LDDLFKRVLIAYPVITFVLWCMKSSMVSMGANFRGNPAWSLISTLSSLFNWGLVIAGGLYAVLWVISTVEAWFKGILEARDESLRSAIRSELRDLKSEITECHERIDELEERRKQDEKEKRDKEFEEKKEQELRDRSPEEAVHKALESFII
jgi:hypothetical protein